LDLFGSGKAPVRTFIRGVLESLPVKPAAEPPEKPPTQPVESPEKREAREALRRARESMSVEGLDL